MSAQLNGLPQHLAESILHSPKEVIVRRGRFAQEGLQIVSYGARVRRRFTKKEASRQLAATMPHTRYRPDIFAWVKRTDLLGQTIDGASDWHDGPFVCTTMRLIERRQAIKVGRRH